MAEKLTKAQFGEHQLDAVKVAVKEATERWSETVLNDGSVLRVKIIIHRAFRAVDSYDNDGNPMYSVKLTHVLDVESPDHLKKGASGTSEVH